MKTLAVLLAALALGVAGCGSDDNESSDTGASGGSSSAAAPAPETTASGGGGGGETLKISADPGGALAFDKDALEAKAGSVTIEMDNPSSLPHAVGIEGNGVDEEGEVVQKGGISKVTADLEPGTYEFYCPVDGHADAGMKGELTVK